MIFSVSIHRALHTFKGTAGTQRSERAREECSCEGKVSDLSGYKLDSGWMAISQGQTQPGRRLVGGQIETQAVSAVRQRAQTAVHRKEMVVISHGFR